MLRRKRIFRQKARGLSRFLDQAARSQIVAFWQARFATLRGKLAETPAADDAWFWKVQCHIIQYLLHRYGDAEMRLSANSQPQITPAELPRGLSAMVLEVKPSNSFTAFPGEGKMPRASGHIGPVLRNIVQVNQERYETFQHSQEAMAEAMRIERATQRDLMQEYRQGQQRRNTMRNFVYDLRDKLGLSESEIIALTDDELEQLVNNNISMEAPAAEKKDVNISKESDDPAS